VATLTSVYADSTIVLGPLSTEREPEAYDLCQKHVDSFTAPRGWQVIRLATDLAPAPPSEDDLLALADAVREASRTPRPVPRRAERSSRGGISPVPLTEVADTLPCQVRDMPGITSPGSEDEIIRRGHLRVLRGHKEG
jgi:hypothetical protein avisC_02230